MGKSLVEIMDQLGIEKITQAKDEFELDLIWTDHLENGRRAQHSQEQAERIIAGTKLLMKTVIEKLRVKQEGCSLNGATTEPIATLQ